MKIDKSLEEVWDWKDKLYEENAGKPLEEIVQDIKHNASVIRKDNNLNLKTLTRPVKAWP